MSDGDLETNVKERCSTILDILVDEVICDSFKGLPGENGNRTEDFAIKFILIFVDEKLEWKTTNGCINLILFLSFCKLLSNMPNNLTTKLLTKKFTNMEKRLYTLWKLHQTQVHNNNIPVKLCEEFAKDGFIERDILKLPSLSSPMLKSVSKYYKESYKKKVYKKFYKKK